MAKVTSSREMFGVFLGTANCTVPTDRFQRALSSSRARSGKDYKTVRFASCVRQRLCSVRIASLRAGKDLSLSGLRRPRHLTIRSILRSSTQQLASALVAAVRSNMPPLSVVPQRVHQAVHGLLSLLPQMFDQPGAAPQSLPLSGVKITAFSIHAGSECVLLHAFDRRGTQHAGPSNDSRTHEYVAVCREAGEKDDGCHIFALPVQLVRSRSTQLYTQTLGHASRGASVRYDALQMFALCASRRFTCAGRRTANRHQRCVGQQGRSCLRLLPGSHHAHQVRQPQQ